MDDNKKTGIEELRRRQATRQDSGQGAPGSGRGGPPRGPGWKLAVLPVLAILIVGAVGLGAYRAGIAGRPDPQPPERPVVQATPDPVVPEEPPEQTQEPAQEQTPEPQGTDSQQEEPSEPSEPTEPEVDHTGQMWGTLCDGTVVYENDSRRIECHTGVYPEVYDCPGGEGNVVSEIILEYPVHIGHETADGNGTRSVRYGEGVTASEFLAGTGYSSFEEMRPASLFNVDGAGILPSVTMKNGLPQVLDLSKPVQAYISEFRINFTSCGECIGSAEWDAYCSSLIKGADISTTSALAPGLLVNGASAYDLDAVVEALGMPVYGLYPRFVDPAYFDASEGYVAIYVWDMGESGVLGIDFKDKQLEVAPTVADLRTVLYY